MSLKKQIEADMKEAMLNKAKDELITLRSIKSLILLAETEKGASKEGLTKEKEIQLLVKAAKQRKESAQIYEEQNRNDLAEKEHFEYKIITRYLPKQLSEEDLEIELKKIIHDVKALSMKDMGKVMGIANKSLAGKADGKAISAMVKKLLS